MGLVFSSYSFMATFLITYLSITRGRTLSPLEVSALLSAGVAILIGIIADIVSLGKETRQ